MSDKEKELNESFIKAGSKVWGVYKFPNGNVAVFGRNEQQVPMLQGPYTRELEEKIRQYSDEKTIWKGFQNLKPMQRALIKSRYFKFCPVIGLGYWKDVYLKEEIGMEGVAHNFVLPFIRIQWGYLVVEK